MQTKLDGPRLGAQPGPARHLVVICHGVGASGDDLIGLAHAWAPVLPAVAFAAPDAPFAYDAAPTGRQWWSLADRAPAKMEAGVRAAAPYLDAFIAAELERLGLPPDAYALAGFSQGAMTVLFTGPRRLPPPRAILAYAGALIAPDTLAAEARNHAPVLIVHGEADDVVPPARSHEAEARLREAGFPVEAHYIPDLDHSLDPTAVTLGAAFLRAALGG
ncbi:alpha/beta hydrolase [Acidisphaera rubrifaciens]|uniref:Phospholipase/carboxylesterase n=1 Tax=Acidisphaera rubrifaciens HS-AP3 TaxID=1231350 RepID=A0A0D6P7C5_9PROT|nr:prolyl oligopeptidase family serine peptidase [Acidisphaera rubrifaciens]GAN77236.1 phospholipase/carboxylesterase [Acidisphaera rubrifaciens HS-AP3]